MRSNNSVDKRRKQTQNYIVSIHEDGARCPPSSLSVSSGRVTHSVGPFSDDRRQCPLLAQSRHELVRRTRLLLTQSGHWLLWAQPVSWNCGLQMGAWSRLTLCSSAFDEFERCFTNADYYTVPRTRIVLPKQARARIPRSGIPVEQPAPIWTVRQQDPDRTSERPGEMNNAGIHRDYEIQFRYERCRIEEIVQRAAEM